jgi:SAM-dependent methyltransferase
LVFDIEKSFPLEDNSFDFILLMNVLEHIYKFENVISESSRVLKKEGKIYLAVPFMHQIHGSPNDFFRYSKATLERLLLENNFEKIEIKELGFGFLSLGFQTFFIGFIPFLFCKNVVKSLFILIDKIILKFSPRYRRWAKNNPMGYWVSATKK